MPENARGSAGTGAPSSSATSCHAMPRRIEPVGEVRRALGAGEAEDRDRTCRRHAAGCLRRRLRARSVRRAAEPRVDGRDDAADVEPALREELRGIAVIDEGVGQPELQERDQDALRRERLGDGAAGAAGDDVLLDRDEASCSRARRDTRSTSSGFTKRMLATVASSSSAAASAGCSIAPNARIAMRCVRARRRRGGPRPCRPAAPSSPRRSATPGPLPRG